MAEHDWVPNVLSEQHGTVCRECGLVSEAFYVGCKCLPSPTFQGIPGFPRKCATYRSQPPAPQGGDYRPHYRKRETDEYISQLSAELTAAEAHIKELEQALLKAKPWLPAGGEFVRLLAALHVTDKAVK